MKKKKKTTKTNTGRTTSTAPNAVTSILNTIPDIDTQQSSHAYLKLKQEGMEEEVLMLIRCMSFKGSSDSSIADSISKLFDVQISRHTYVKWKSLYPQVREASMFSRHSVVGKLLTKAVDCGMEARTPADIPNLIQLMQYIDDDMVNKPQTTQTTQDCTVTIVNDISKGGGTCDT